VVLNVEPGRRLVEEEDTRAVNECEGKIEATPIPRSLDLRSAASVSPTQ
jgi:hypothetical protein